MRGSRIILSITLAALVAVMIVFSAFAGGRIEHHQITSKFLDDAGQPASRELSLYLPEEYDLSESVYYPVLYLLHGWTGTNRTFLGQGYPSYNGLIGEIYINETMDTLIEQGVMYPMVVVLPHVRRDLSHRSVIPFYRDYMVEEIIPFVDTQYRTIPTRDARAIAGHSVGGNDAVLTAGSRPEMFSLVGTYTAYYERTPSDDIFHDADLELFPLHFWIYVGTQDQYSSIPFWNRRLVDVLKAMGLPHKYIEDDGNHWNRIKQRIEESLVFFSEHLMPPETPVEPHHRLATMWGSVKRGR